MTSAFQTFIDAFSRVDLEKRSLGGDFVLCPPDSNSGYASTPRNAVTFSKMGVDGVHTAILKVNGRIQEDSPVVYVSPMDSDDVTVIARSFLSFLAEGCRTTYARIESLLADERSGKVVLVAFLSKRFKFNPLLKETRVAEFNRVRLAAHDEESASQGSG